MSNDNVPQLYINTPFAYTKLSKNLSLLQQSVLVKVSEHLQYHVQKYFGSDLCKSHDIPRPLFSAAEKNNGIPVFFVSYAELGVAINNYQMARAAVKEVMELTINAPGVDANGNPSVVAYSIFSKINVSTNESNGIAFTLNPEVVDYVFDMSQGYVRHPANIAQIGQVERMPMMYYYLFKRSERWKKREVHLTVEEIKDYFGMRKKKKTGDTDRRGRPTKGNGIQEAYPKFSKFNAAVLAKSIGDINRLKHDGLLDVCVSYEPVYAGKKKVGNPTFIRFCIYDTIADMQKATAKPQQSDLFAVDATGMAEWQKVLQLCPAKVAEGLNGFTFLSYDDKISAITLGASSRAQVEEFERMLTEGEMETFRKALHEGFGKLVKLGYRIRKE